MLLPPDAATTTAAPAATATTPSALRVVPTVPLAPLAPAACTVPRKPPIQRVSRSEITLTPLEMRLLCTLFERRGRVQSRGTLLDDVW